MVANRNGNREIYFINILVNTYIYLIHRANGLNTFTYIPFLKKEDDSLIFRRIKPVLQSDISWKPTV